MKINTSEYWLEGGALYAWQHEKLDALFHVRLLHSVNAKFLQRPQFSVGKLVATNPPVMDQNPGNTSTKHMQNI
jgi:hypothetical protein